MFLDLDRTHMNTQDMDGGRFGLLHCSSGFVPFGHSQSKENLSCFGNSSLCLGFWKFQFISCKNDFSLMIKTSNVL